MPESRKRKLYVIVPAFNEERTVYALLEKVSRIDVSDLVSPVKVIVVDDGSTDGTADEIRRFQSSNPSAPIQYERLDRNGGKGCAIREGLSHCEDEDGIVLIQDADLEYDPGDFPELLAPILRGESEVVFGSRRLRGESTSRSGWLYSLGGWIENLFLHLLYRSRVTDIATGYKVLPVGLMKSLNLSCAGFEFCTEVTAKLLNRGHRIIEVPIRYRARKKSEGKKIRWTDLFIGLATLLKVKLYRE